MSADGDTDPAVLIQDCEDREERLTDWERGFLDSIGKQLEHTGHLSLKQIETLERIWDTATAKG